MKRPTHKLKASHKDKKPERNHSRENLQKIMDQSLDVICVVDEEGRFTQVSRACKQVWGYEPEELIGKQYLDIVYEEDHAITNEAAARVMAGVDVRNFENRYIRKDNSIVPITWSARWDAKEKLIFAIARDASEKKEAEEKLKESEEKFRSAIERVSDAFVALNKNWCYTYMNKRAGEIFGRNPEAMVGKHIWTEFPEGIDQPFYKAYYRAMAEQKYIKLEEYYPPYDQWFVNHIYPSPDGLSIYFYDITERKKAEEKIRINEIRLVNAQEIGRLGYWELARNSKTIWASEKVLEIFGFPTDATEISIEKVEACIPDIDKVRQATTGLVRHDKKYEIEILIHPTDGSHAKYISSIARIDKGIHGTPPKIMGVIQDITERKTAEKRLVKAYKETTTILESITDGFLTVDKNWTVKYWNKAAERIMGMNRDHIIDKNLWEVYADAIPTKFYSEFNRAMEKNIPINFEEYFPPLDIWFRLTIYPSRDGISVFFQDITENKKSEKEIRRFNEKLNHKNVELEEKNIKLEDIAWIQSHKVRAPVARIMGLVDLLTNYRTKEMDTNELLDYIAISANELDGLIKEIVNKTEQVSQLNQ